MSRVGAENGDALLMSLTGSNPNDIEEDVVTKGSGLSRGDKRRNAKLAELRRLVPRHTSKTMLAPNTDSPIQHRHSGARSDHADDRAEGSDNTLAKRTCSVGGRQQRPRAH
jgi:hypothetical protein